MLDKNENYLLRGLNWSYHQKHEYILVFYEDEYENLFNGMA
jgi:hypothetical protein